LELSISLPLKPSRFENLILKFDGICKSVKRLKLAFKRHFIKQTNIRQVCQFNGLNFFNLKFRIHNSRNVLYKLSFAVLRVKREKKTRPPEKRPNKIQFQQSRLTEWESFIPAVISMVNVVESLSLNGRF